MSIIAKYLTWLRKVCGMSPASQPAETSAQQTPSQPSSKNPAMPSSHEEKRVNPPAKTVPETQDAPKKSAAVPVEKTEKTAKKPATAAQQQENAQPEQEATPKQEVPTTPWQPPEPVRENPSDVIFQDFDIHPKILRAILEDLHFVKCTPIQALALPHSLAGNDLAGKAQTGTGKTAAFLITMLQRFLQGQDTRPARKPNQPFALALAPTRELAIQIAHDANALCAYCHFKTVAVYGGMDYDKQRRLLNDNVDMIVATPGRLIDYLNQHIVDLDRVETLIIDEADRMLDMGFIPDVKRIVYRLKAPETRQTMLFSATLSHDIMNLAARWMRPNPITVEVEPEHIVAEGIEETIYAVTSAEKFSVLLWTLKNEDCHRVLIFRNRRKDVDELQEQLKRCGIEAQVLSGDVDQKKRLKILEDFKNGTVKMIVATDVAGRGIHVDDVTHVINYDFPYEAEDYVHRVGRTARAGHRGRAISFADEESAFVIPDIEKYIGRPLPITQPTDDMLATEKPQVKPAHHSANGGRPSGAPHRNGGARRPPRRNGHR